MEQNYTRLPEFYCHECKQVKPRSNGDKFINGKLACSNCARLSLIQRFIKLFKR